jgi:hypothetical protein
MEAMLEFETSAVLEHQQHFARMGQLLALNESQLWAEISMRLKQYHKYEITNNGPTTKYESQQWAEIGVGLKQYNKGRDLILNNITNIKNT